MTFSTLLLNRAIYFCLAFALMSCDENEVIKESIQWEKFEFPGENVVYSIYGNMDDYLLVATSTKILRTGDGGKTWQEVKNVFDPVGSFLNINDVIHATTNGTDWISYDHGITWEEHTVDNELNAPWQSFNDTNGILYRIVDHFNGELALPTTLLRSTDHGNSWETSFPHKHVIYSWHIDANNKVYLGTNGAQWDGQMFKEEPDYKAVLYYTK